MQNKKIIYIFILPCNMQDFYTTCYKTDTSDFLI